MTQRHKAARRRRRAMGSEGWVKLRPGAGQAIKDARTRRGWSQKKLGALVDVSSTAISFIETESPRMPTVSRRVAEGICTELGLPLGLLFDPRPRTSTSTTVQVDAGNAA